MGSAGGEPASRPVAGADALSPLGNEEFARYLDEVRALVLEEIDRIIPRGGPIDGILYERMRDYPLRPAKGLRPALCYAVCRSLGGSAASVLRTAAVIELYHNAFLIHDDVEDQSWSRRNEPTLHAAYGEAIAVNVGDGMLLLCQEALDANMQLLGLGQALRIRRTMLRMSREAVEGQAMELEWIRANRWDLADADYLRMVHKKTSWYSFTAPLVLGATIAGLAEERQLGLRWLAALLGAAFQIQDDILNLVGDPARTGKERCGDLWEGKHTLVLAHMMRSVSPAERAALTSILSKARPASAEGIPGSPGNVEREMDAMLAEGLLDGSAAARLRRGLRDTAAAFRAPEDVAALLAAIERCGSIKYARAVAARRIARAERLMVALHRWLPACKHRDFLDAILAYVLRRPR
jgi:geranylgeranyl diphosphate synthase type II